MSNFIPERATGLDTSRLLVTIAELELEVDRLRRHGTFLEQEATATLTSILRLGTPAPDSPVPTLADVQSAARSLLEIVKDLRDLPGDLSAHDQVVAIAVRPLASCTRNRPRKLLPSPTAPATRFLQLKL
jgi:hypothetical protein